MSSPSLTLPSQERPAARRRRLLEILGALAIAATYVYLVLNQPADITGGPGSASALIALTGFLAGAILLIVAVLPTLPASTLVLIPVALVLNIVLGQFVGSTLVPFYLDAIGTVMIAVLAGPAAGAATGALSSVVWSFFNPTVLPFAAGAALIGCLAGLAARYGLFRRFYLAPVAGFVTGIIAGVVSAPVAAFVFGGTSGVATGAIVSAFRAMGDTLLAAITKQALISDPMDKAIVFTIVAVLVYALPRRARQQFPFLRRHRVLAGNSQPIGTRADAPVKDKAHGTASGSASDSTLNG
ncbi:ECF transporter S component [Arthrobacter sp. ISL-85]|uniref:ECF transporter S component n=1 Tax=Arthrobacter sp. ISL-85 TaxID=2819115 RepID=UPI001BEC1F8F|nr:ECF transporter S component [Arthrobacter sp. ISL-85]MBT2568613.1 ECF transporter S component [Arthrobacter sp. ISL-85]